MPLNLNDKIISELDARRRAVEETSIAESEAYSDWRKAREANKNEIRLLTAQLAALVAIAGRQ